MGEKASQKNANFGKGFRNKRKFRQKSAEKRKFCSRVAVKNVIFDKTREKARTLPKGNGEKANLIKERKKREFRQ